METFEKYKSVIGDPIKEQRAKHAVAENQRTIETAVAALKEDNIELFGQLMNQSHISLRDDYEVSCEEIDILVRPRMEYFRSDWFSYHRRRIWRMHCQHC